MARQGFSDATGSLILGELPVPLKLNPEQWYALRVRARFEKQASELLKLKGYQTLLPVSVSRRRWTDRIRQVESALFPGYVFCRMAELSPGLALTTPGVMHFVGFGPTPAPVDDAEIAAIERIIEAGAAGNPWPYLKVGETVEITSGPLLGLTGFLLAINGDRQLVVGISLLQRSLAIELPPSCIVGACNGRLVRSACRNLVASGKLEGWRQAAPAHCGR